jgi:hypothetical protein
LFFHFVFPAFLVSPAMFLRTNFINGKQVNFISANYFGSQLKFPCTRLIKIDSAELERAMAGIQFSLRRAAGLIHLMKWKIHWIALLLVRACCIFASTDAWKVSLINRGKWVLSRRVHRHRLFIHTAGRSIGWLLLQNQFFASSLKRKSAWSALYVYSEWAKL